MTRFSHISWKSRSFAAFLALAIAAPLAATPALADDWRHDRDELRDTGWHHDRDDWRRPYVVAPTPVYVAPAYPSPVIYAPPPPPAYYAPPPPPAYYPAVPTRAAYACSGGATAGGLIGAAAGGLIGSQIGRSSGNVAATVLGILGGAAVGASVGAASGCP